jgi:hypothetical protein
MPSARYKVNLSLCLTNYALHHKGVWGSGCIDPHLFDLDTGWSGQLHTPAALSRGKEPRYPFDKRLVGPRAGLDYVEKILDPNRTRTPTPRSSSPIASRYTDYAIPALVIHVRKSFTWI